MTYPQFDYTKPNPVTDNGTQAFTLTRENLLALRDGVLMGTMQGWTMALSGGTAEQPTQILYSRGDERVRLTLTWNASGNPSQIVYAYSANSGTSYSAIGTETITYDVSGNVTGVTWS